MKILAIDTTTERGSIALADGDRVIEEQELPAGDGFGHVLFTEMQALLDRHGVRMTDIDGYACASGPGTFTGVRLGLTAAKGLAEAASRKVVALSNLKAMAFFGTAALRAPMLDARRGEIYGAVYNSSLELVQDEVVTSLEAWKAGLPEGAEILSEPRLLAGAIAMIAAREFSAGRSLDPAEADANYVRRSDAEQMWKEAL